MRYRVSVRCEHPSSLPNCAPDVAKCGAPFEGKSFREVKANLRLHWIEKHSKEQQR